MEVNHTASEVDENREECEPRLQWSESFGYPTSYYKPETLAQARNLCPNKMGARIKWVKKDTVVKYGLGVRLAEAEAMKFISENTSIVLPQLRTAYILDGITYIVMSYEEGQPLSKYWDSATDEQKANVLTQLRDYVNQMQDIKGDFIGSVDHSHCVDGIFDFSWSSRDHRDYGPFETEEAFNEGIVQAYYETKPPGRPPPERDSEEYYHDHFMKSLIRSLKGHDIVFCHGDIHPGNVIVRDDGTVVLLDWGLAGLWPAYWEHYRAMSVFFWKETWAFEVEKFVPNYYMENYVMSRIFNLL